MFKHYEPENNLMDKGKIKDEITKSNITRSKTVVDPPHLKVKD